MVPDNKERIKAIISAVVIIFINIAALFGVNVTEGDALTNALLVIVDMAAVIWGIWKNHNFTPEAAIAQDYLDSLKLANRAK